MFSLYLIFYLTVSCIILACVSLFCLCRCISFLWKYPQYVYELKPQQLSLFNRATAVYLVSALYNRLNFPTTCSLYVSLIAIQNVCCSTKAFSIHSLANNSWLYSKFSSFPSAALFSSPSAHFHPAIMSCYSAFCLSIRLSACVCIRKLFA